VAKRRLAVIVVSLIAVVIVLAAGAIGFAEIGSERKLNRIVTVDVAPIAVATGTAAMARGQYLFNSRGCGECHGSDGAGKVMIDSGGLYVRTPNISSAPDSIAATLSDRDWVKIIRHGIKPSDRPLLIMPSEDFARYTDADVAAIILYARSLPPVAGLPAELRLPLPVRLLYAMGIVRDAAEKIDHSLPAPLPVPAGDLLANGAYAVNGCIGCHNASLSGGAIPGAPPDWPPAANLTSAPSSAMRRYPTADAFAAMFKSGMRPDGSAVSAVMPFGALREFSDEDIKAVYAYLKTLPPRETGEHARDVALP
jgi:mono/diheme cytochrome c family protein